MEFAAENFPMYQLLTKLNLPGIEQAKADFAAAQNGGDEEKYQFMMGLYTVATAPGLAQALPGMTPEIVKTTLEQAYAVFEDAGGRGHANAALMTAFMKAAGQGTEPDFTGARDWLDRAEKLGGESDFTRELRKKLTPVPFAAAKKPGMPGNNP